MNFCLVGTLQCDGVTSIRLTCPSNNHKTWINYIRSFLADIGE